MKLNRTHLALVAAAGLLMTVATGCKPTEKNYKAAYDAALAKRQHVEVDMDIPAEGLMVDGEPVRKNLDGHDVTYLVSSLASFTDGGLAPLAYNVVTGCFKMPVNALDQARSLREKRLPAFAVKGEQEKYYSVAASFETLEEALVFYDEFIAANPSFSYVGVPALTIIEKR